MASSSAPIRAALPQRRPGYRLRRCASYFDHDKFKLFSRSSHTIDVAEMIQTKILSAFGLGKRSMKKRARFAMNYR
ncbi:hypothetical protein SAMN05216338_1001838 [Bradyrhizobium sp. Rc2d]|uniref:hypothetical protein n=1 Tax=Bradyrhizobium sp. Rc2d TaxID=1855321 RepID=UPI000880CA23|nr:hypothetical protein [Bradyrhizobium sp. Rc2d]SDG59215.1 hypothetical protein SAMN05216338_1001838 [Bradyrhizobium sp. Rc2d]